MFNFFGDSLIACDLLLGLNIIFGLLVGLKEVEMAAYFVVDQFILGEVRLLGVNNTSQEVNIFVPHALILNFDLIFRDVHHSLFEF